MKHKVILASAFTFLLTAAATASFADDKDTQLLGESEPISAASRTVVINSDTAYVNVTHGDTIDFLVGAQHVVWNFNGAPSLREIDLSRIVPAGTLDHKVRVYIARNHHADYGT